MTVHLDIINPLNHPDWDRLLIDTPGSSFFHTAAWARVLAETYGYKPLYFVSWEGERIKRLLPLMEIDSFLTGKRGVCLPFSDYCPVITDTGTPRAELLDEVITYGKEARWKYFEIRSDLADSPPPFSRYCLHTVGLSGDETAIFKRFRESTKRNIRKASKNGVKVRFENSLASVKEYYRLHCMTRKKHGVPPQPFLFFRNVHKHVIGQNKGFAALACYKDTIVAGNIYFHFGKKAYYKFGASDGAFQQVRGSNLVMWEAIKWFSEQGFDALCLGRTRTDDKGLLQYKQGWGAERKEIKYYRYDLGKDSFVAMCSGNHAFQTKVISMMPTGVLRIAGSLLYKHIG